LSEARAQRRTEHAARMFRWEIQVAQDPLLLRHAVALKAVTFIRSQVDPNTGAAEIDQPWLARKVGCSRKGLQKALYKLQELGHLDCECRKGQRRPNIYRPKVLDMRTGGRIEPTCEPEYAVDANQRAPNVRTAVRTYSGKSLSNAEGRPMKLPQQMRRRGSNRGAIEREVARRLGGNAGEAAGWGRLMEMPPDVVAALCARQRAGELSDDDLAQQRSRAPLARAAG
jgi:hypothetical protein